MKTFEEIYLLESLLSFEDIYQLREKKDHIINKLNLTPEEKQQTIDFFNKHPNYESKVNWQNKNLTFNDFKSIMSQQENSKSNIVKQTKSGNLSAIWKQLPDTDYQILYNDNKEIYVLIKSYQVAVFCDSFDCYGFGAKWCIGTKNNSSYWDHYTGSKRSLFVLYYDALKKEKYMNQIMFENNDISNLVVTVWNSEDKDIYKRIPFDKVFENKIDKSLIETIYEKKYTYEGNYEISKAFVKIAVDYIFNNPGLLKDCVLNDTSNKLINYYLEKKNNKNPYDIVYQVIIYSINYRLDIIFDYIKQSKIIDLSYFYSYKELFDYTGKGTNVYDSLLYQFKKIEKDPEYNQKKEKLCNIVYPVIKQTFDEQINESNKIINILRSIIEKGFNNCFGERPGWANMQYIENEYKKTTGHELKIMYTLKGYRCVKDIIFNLLSQEDKKCKKGWFK